MKHARRRDENEKEIVEALEAIGASAQRLDGLGVPDLLVGYRGATFLLEVKRQTATGKPKRTQPGRRLQSEAATDARGLLDSQQKWWRRWRGAEPVVVTTPEEALAAIGYALVTPPKPEPPAIVAFPGAKGPIPMYCSECLVVFDARHAIRYTDGVRPPAHWRPEKRSAGGKIPLCEGYRRPAMPVGEPIHPEYEEP